LTSALCRAVNPILQQPDIIRTLQLLYNMLSES
jgi:hypothetical protein